MMSVVLVAVNHPCSLAFRAVEVEQIQKRNMLLALAISIVIHALIIGSYYLFPSPAIDMTKEKFKQPGDRPWSNKQLNFEQLDIPSIFSGPAPRVTDVKAGKIVAVRDDKANPMQTFATQEQLKKGVVLGGDNVGDGNGDAGTGDVSGVPGDIVIEEDVEPQPFLPVEQQPVLVRRVAPKYPELMLKAEIEGKVTVSIWIDKEGKPRQVRILKSDNELFNEAAMEAAKQFLFTPAYMNNGPVSVWVSVPFTFRLQ